MLDDTTAGGEVDGSTGARDPVVGHRRALGPIRRAGVMVAPGTAAVVRAVLDRGVEHRARRFVAAARDRRAERRRASQPTMRSLHLRKPGRLEWREVPAPPPPGPLAAVVAPIAVATCDLDRPLAMGTVPFPMPLALGHECVAEVVAVGDDVTTVTPGQRVVVPFQISCGHCRPCRGGSTSNCASVPPLSMYGFGVAAGHWGGVLADRVAVPFADAMLVPLPDAVDPVAAASAADTMSDAYRHIGPHLPRLLERDPGASVLIVGTTERGPRFAPSTLLYAGQIALALGAPGVRLVDRRPHVREAAEQLGMTSLRPAQLRHTPRAQLVVAGSATPGGLATALDKTAPDGVCTSVGGLHHSARVPVASTYARNLTYHIGRSNVRTCIPPLLAMIDQGRIDPMQIVSARGDFDDALDVLDRHYRSEDIKTVLTRDPPREA